MEEIQVNTMSNIKERAVTHDYRYVGKKRYFGAVRYYDYMCYKDTIRWYALLGLNLTDAVYHRSGSGLKSLSYTKSQTYGTETASQFSSGVGADAGFGDMVKASVNLGYGITKTKRKSFTASSTVAVEIPQNSKTGYYKIVVAHNFYSMKIDMKRTTGSLEHRSYMSIPYGEAYAATVYSPDCVKWTIW